MNNLNKSTILNSLISIKKSKKRVGRGQGSGLGKTCGRGNNGSKARSGYKSRVLKTSQMGFITRFPRRGFNGRKKNKLELKISDINKLIQKYKLKTISVKDLQDVGYISSKKDYFLSLIGNMKSKQDKPLKCNYSNNIENINIVTNKVSKSAENIIKKKTGNIIEVI